MKHKHFVLVILLSIFAFNLLLLDLSYASEDRVLSKVEDGYRILNLGTRQGIQKFTVYRGDYIKFRLPEKMGESFAVFPTLKEKKQVTHDLKTSSYFKMKQIGTYPFQIKSIKGQISVIEYQQASYKALSSKHAKTYIKTDNPLILDVRTPKEYATGHLENSILLPVQELQKRISELDVHKNNAILIYCASGNRSTVASKILIDAGFKKIFNLRHGISGWAKNNYPIVQ
ncbi:MAG: rhodanese-like domain-containing protein [Desulfobacula sp.]|jgi:rhodanese-related sulfurtransferase|nr:rhodanese-like domain-containing protein [Desulfobacula sp.]